MKYKTFSMSMIFFFIVSGLTIWVLILILELSFVGAYTYQETTIDSNQAFIFTMNKSEQPLAINFTIGQFNFTGYQTGCTTNCSNGSFLNVTQATFSVSCGDLISCEDFVLKAPLNESNSTVYNITIEIDEDIHIGDYDSYVEIESNGTAHRIEFRFLVQWGDLFDHKGVLELNEDTQTPKIIAYQGDLPQSGTRDYTIKTQPGEIMYLDCGEYLTCSHKNITTTNFTTFSVTYLLQAGMAIGTYRSYVKINTSYNTSMSINYTFQITESQVQVIYQDLSLNRSLENMTPEELVDFYEKMQSISNEAINKLNAANKSKDIVVEKNVTQYVAVNEDDIAQKVMELLWSENSEYAAKMYKDNSELRQRNSELEQMMIETRQEVNTTIAKKLDELNALERNMTDAQVTLEEYDSALKEAFFVWNKTKLIKVILIILGMTIIIGGYFYIDKKAHPGS